jgi:hypothetical protein
MLDGLRIEAARSILSSTGGDMLRMGANALYDAETSNGMSLRVYLSEFPVGNIDTFRGTCKKIYAFLRDMDPPLSQQGQGQEHGQGQGHVQVQGQGKRQLKHRNRRLPTSSPPPPPPSSSSSFYSCLSLDESINKTMQAGYIEYAPGGAEHALNERQHVTAGFLTPYQKERYRGLLAADPVVGPILTLLAAALAHQVPLK